MRRAGDRLRFAAKLIRATEDSPLWSETFDRTVHDVFAVQDEITSRVVDTIAGALQLGKLRGQVPVAATRNLEAYDLYLLGRHHWSERSEAGMRRARELFEQALALDPAYAPAWSGLADALAVLASWQFADPAEMYPVATDAARRALELDESLAEAHASLGFVKMNWEWDWDGVLRELRRAIELNPNHETAHRWLSAFLAGIGRFDEAMPIAERARAARSPLGASADESRDHPHAVGRSAALLKRGFADVLAMNPAFLRALLFLGAVLGLQRKYDESIRIMSELVERGNRAPFYIWGLAMAHAMAARTREARELLAPLDQSKFPALYRAEVYLLSR